MIKFDLNTANGRASAEAIPFHALIVLVKNDCPYWLVVWPISKFHAVFSSSTLIRLDKDAFEGHLCQTVNNFVKQNKSSLLSPLRRGVHPNISSISGTLEYLKYLLLTNLTARRCTLSILSLLYFWYGSQTVILTYTCGCSVASNWQPGRPCSDLHSNNLHHLDCC